ncbi:MAG: hypothetical protein AAB483_03355 [Patescibacteria group bacterium]
MQWFFERISAHTLPISFGINERKKYPSDFSKLIEKKILVQGQYLEAVPCTLCEEGHECLVRDADNEVFYVCENGAGRKTLSNEDLAIFDYNNDALLKLIANELGIKVLGNGAFSDQGTHAEQVLYSIGKLYHGKVSGEVLYLRTNNDAEVDLYVAQVQNGAKIILSNTQKPTLKLRFDNVFFATLADMLADGKSKTWFDKEKLTASLEGIRQVNFDKATGQLYLNGKLKYTPEPQGPHYWFLLYLWDAWERPRTYQEIYDYVCKQTGKQSADTPQKFCQKMKSEIKNKYAGIDKIISIPSTGSYMMTDPKG